MHFSDYLRVSIMLILKRLETAADLISINYQEESLKVSTRSIHAF